MQLPNDEPTICALCEEKPATEKYTRGGHTEMVCATCSDRWAVQDALEDGLLEIIALERRKLYDEALARLDTILESNRHRDHDGWLAGSVTQHRASILFDAGRYADAEQAYNEWAQLGFIDVWRRRMHGLGMAKTLEALGRDRQAVSVLEDVLHHEDPKDPALALTVLTELVRISDNLALPVDAKWLKIAEEAANCHGVDMPVRDSPGKAILALEEKVRSMQPKRPKDAE